MTYKPNTTTTMKKYLLTISLALFSFSATNAQIEWSLSEDGTLTISGKSMPDYGLVSDTDAGETTAPWYPQNDKIKKVVIEEGVTRIGVSAFDDCSSLTSVTIPNSVKSIGDEAFYGCSRLTSITIPSSVTSIGAGTFKDCPSLASVTIPNSVTSIGEGAFSGCKALTSVTIPNSVRSIGDEAFFGCTSLKEIAIPNSVKSIGDEAFYGCVGITSLTIPGSVTSIGKRAFSLCSSLSSISFEGKKHPDMWENTFENVKRTIPVYVPANSIEAYEKALGKYFVEISKQAPFLATNAQIEWTLSEDGTLTISGTRMPDYIHYVIEGYKDITTAPWFPQRDKIKKVVIEDGVTYIGRKAFYLCDSITSVTIPNSVKSIGNNAFARCKGLTSITIPNSVTSIEEFAFSKCTGLESIVIPESITSIEDDTFNDCWSLMSITIPNSVKSIGESAFAGSCNLMSITFEGNTPPQLGKEVFEGVNKSVSVFVPADSKKAYRNALGKYFEEAKIKSLTRPSPREGSTPLTPSRGSR